MPGLRPRLVLIVGIAMLAPGALAVLQAISSYGSSMRIIEQNLAQAATARRKRRGQRNRGVREILTSSPPARRARRHRTGVSPRPAASDRRLDQYEGAWS
jgi:hypothetical protein